MKDFMEDLVFGLLIVFVVFCYLVMSMGFVIGFYGFCYFLTSIMVLMYIFNMKIGNFGKIFLIILLFIGFFGVIYIDTKNSENSINTIINNEKYNISIIKKKLENTNKEDLIDTELNYKLLIKEIDNKKEIKLLVHSDSPIYKESNGRYTHNVYTITKESYLRTIVYKVLVDEFSLKCKAQDGLDCYYMINVGKDRLTKEESKQAKSKTIFINGLNLD